jgi:hypothetical protein
VDGWTCHFRDVEHPEFAQAKMLVETDGNPDGFQVAYVHGDSHYFRLDKPFLVRRAGASRTLHASKRSAITRRMATMTRTG